MFFKDKEKQNTHEKIRTTILSHLKFQGIDNFPDDWEDAHSRELSVQLLEISEIQADEDTEAEYLCILELRPIEQKLDYFEVQYSHIFLIDKKNEEFLVTDEKSFYTTEAYNSAWLIASTDFNLDGKNELHLGRLVDYFAIRGYPSGAVAVFNLENNKFVNTWSKQIGIRGGGVISYLKNVNQYRIFEADLNKNMNGNGSHFFYISTYEYKNNTYQNMEKRYTNQKIKLSKDNQEEAFFNSVSIILE